jgi:hypothetical protein
VITAADDSAQLNQIVADEMAAIRAGCAPDDPTADFSESYYVVVFNADGILSIEFMVRCVTLDGQYSNYFETGMSMNVSTAHRMTLGEYVIIDEHFVDTVNSEFVAQAQKFGYSATDASVMASITAASLEGAGSLAAPQGRTGLQSFLTRDGLVIVVPVPPEALGPWWIFLEPIQFARR